MATLSSDGQVFSTAQQAIANQLRREILQGELAPGSKLVQSEVAARMRTSTTPVREAMMELASAGLLRIDAHRTVVVAELDRAELEDVYELRELVESAMVRKAVLRVTPEQLEGLAALVERMDREADMVTWVELNREFHALLTRAAHSPRLEAMTANLRDVSARYVAAALRADPQHTRAGNADHRELVEACRSGDGERAARAVASHLGKTVRLSLATLDRERGGPDGSAA